MRPSQRRFAIGFALCVVLALTIALILGREGLQRAHYLRVLRENPSRLEEMLLSSSLPEAAAARDFLAEPEGKKALFRLYLDEYDRNQAVLNTKQFLMGLEKSSVDRGILALWEDGYHSHTWTGGSGQSSFTMANRAENPARRSLILELLRALVGETFRLPGIALEFQIQPAGNSPRWPGDDSNGTSRTLPETPPGARYLCFFRIVEPRGN